MLRDVFYFGEKPNVHPRERYATDLSDAKRQSTTEHFWVINEHCNYKDFDWDWDFDFLPDEDVWAEEHNNVWPSPYQKDSGTWLCSTDIDAVIIYRNDVEPIPLKEEITSNWKIIEYIEKDKFDFKWHPDPGDPPYIYVWGNKWYPGTIMPTVEYHVPGATDRKYILDHLAPLLPMPRLFNIIYEPANFDYSWRPDPTAPPYIYVFGNNQYPASVMPTVEFHVDGATDRKFIENIVPKLAARPADFEALEDVDPTTFDMTWVPDPTAPPYIYAWGNQWNKPEDKISVIRKVEGATEYKYMEKRVKRNPCMDNWDIPDNMFQNKFDFSWESNPHDPPFIYQFGTQWQKTGGPRYIVEGATEVKYIDVLKADVVCTEFENWQVPRNVDQTKFNFSWHPDSTEEPYIYQFPDQWTRTGGPRYVVPEATEIKYIDIQTATAKHDKTHWVIPEGIDTTEFDFSWHPDIDHAPLIYQFGTQHQRTCGPKFYAVGCTEDSDIEYIDVTKAKALVTTDNWSTHEDIVDFDYSWHPDATEQPYIYQWGNKHYGSDLQPTVEYIVPSATEIKHMSQDVKLTVSDKWIENYSIDKTKFDMSWRPDPTSPPYIYAWGNKHISAELKPTIEYHVDGATEYKFISEVLELLPEFDKWVEFQPIDKNKFDFTWRPDPTSPPYIYVWGNKHIAGELLSTIEYHVPGATEKKYMEELVTVLPEMDKWVITQDIDKDIFDFTWRPDPTSPPYVYVWGNKYISGELLPTIEYHAEGATERKYMDTHVAVVPEIEKWKELQQIDKTKFDMSWRPDPREPAFIYVWGNKHIEAELEPTLEYHCDGATERKYMGNVEVLPEFDRWREIQPVDRTKFDLTWRPDPREPAYIYVWGNKHIAAELKSTIEYHCPSATEKKYMKEDADVLPISERWKIIQDVDNFDFTWRPDPREPDYIYVWGNKHIAGELKPTLEYHCENATERKYIGNVDVAPEWDRYQILIPVDKSSFDFTWRPDPREPAFIYVWGNQSNSAEKEPTVEYHCEGATERKHMTDKVVKTLPVVENWKILIPVDNFDFSWRPDPDSPPYSYVFGNQWHDAMTEPTLEYHVEGAKDKKYVTDIIANVSKTQEHWKTLISVESFDYSWRPNPHSSPYIYVFGNQWHDAVIEPTIEYHQPGAIDKKYIVDIVATSKSTATESHWKRLIPVESFDYSWRPDPKSPPYIYVFGNKWNDATTEPSIEYHVVGSTEYKYMADPVATPQSNLAFWSINNNDDLETFDFTWRPNPHSPPQIYQWADNGPRYTMPDATEVVFMERTVETRKTVVNRYKIKTTLEDLIAEHSEEVFWAINPDLTYDKFDFSWRPNEENFRHINVFGNEYSMNTQTYYVNAPLYMMGHREFNYVEGQTVEIDSNLSMFYIDRGNNEGNERLTALKARYPQIQKTRYLNSWVDTINRCINKSQTKLCWVLNSEIDYSEFEFDFYPSPWQEKMVHVFGTQWSHWGTTFMINKESFPEDTKYVKIIEHLSVLNFVKSKRTKAKNCLYPIYLIDHGNEVGDTIKDIPVTKVKYEHSYLRTFKKLLATLPQKNEHYIWVCSSVCDYENFDFSYICDPYAKDQLHVFPSDKQKFGDTFLIDVNKFKSLIDDMIMMEDYEKVNYNQHQRVKRLLAPVIITKEDTHVTNIHTDFDWPYATFVTEDNKELDVHDIEPISLWTPNTKNILITSTGATRIIVPKEAKDYVENELYDYPYISRSKSLAQSQPLDIVFLSNSETGADENYEHLLKVTKGLRNRVVRVDGVNGRVQAYHAAAEASNTPWMFTVFAKLKVNSKFDWTWQPDRLQIPKHYIFHATNPVNGLEYGHQAMIAYNKKITLANSGTGLDFTLDNEHEVVELNSGVAIYNTDEWCAWRTAFREALKLRADDSQVSEDRLDAWLNKGEGSFAQYSCEGAQHAVEYYESVNGELDKLRLSYDWPWLKEYFNAKYN